MSHQTARDRAGEKAAVRAHWEREACGTGGIDAPAFSREYFEAIEAARYGREPEVFSFAQFTRAHGRKVLEIGVGAGTDFVQWVRAGGECVGVDLTAQALAHTRRRLEIGGLRAAGLVRADAEHLPFPDDHFDLVYSWGVMHHTPDPARAIREALRCLKPGGRGLLMLYHRRSLFAWSWWLRKALLSGRPGQGVAACLADSLESPGTKAYTRREVREMFRGLAVTDLTLATRLTYYDRVGFLPGRWRARPGIEKLALAAGGVLARFLGEDTVGWFMTIEFLKAKPGGRPDEIDEIP